MLTGGRSNAVTDMGRIQWGWFSHSLCLFIRSSGMQYEGSGFLKVLVVWVWAIQLHLYGQNAFLGLTQAASFLLWKKQTFVPWGLTASCSATTLYTPSPNCLSFSLDFHKVPYQPCLGKLSKSCLPFILYLIKLVREFRQVRRAHIFLCSQKEPPDLFLVLTSHLQYQVGASQLCPISLGDEF